MAPFQAGRIRDWNRRPYKRTIVKPSQQPPLAPPSAAAHPPPYATAATASHPSSPPMPTIHVYTQHPHDAPICIHIGLPSERLKAQPKARALGVSWSLALLMCSVGELWPAVVILLAAFLAWSRFA